MEKCVCGRWFKSRKQLFRHGGRCKAYQEFAEWYREGKKEAPDIPWKEFKEVWMADHLLP